MKTIGIETWGGIGDAWLVTPSFKALKNNNPEANIRVLCNDNHYALYKNNPFIDYLSTCPEDEKFRNITLTNTNYGKLQPSIHFTKHVVEIIADLLGVTLVDKRLMIFLTEEEQEKALNILSLYPNPIAIQVSASSSSSKDWGIANWQSLVDSMPEFTFIQLGIDDRNKLVNSVDLRSKLSLRESIALIKYACCFVGCDSVYGHATNAVATPGVILFGPTTPVVWGYPDNINLFMGLECSPCIDTARVDNCPYGYRCMSSISLDEVRNAILKIMGSISG